MAVRVLSGFVVVLLGLATPVGGAQGLGGIRGQVNYVGSVPAAEAHRIGGDDFCEKIHAHRPILKQEVIVSGEKTLKNVVVWVSSGWPEGKEPNAATTDTATVVQQGCQLIPHVVAIQAGQTLTVKNADPTVQNLHLLPKENAAVNVLLEPQSAAKVLRFDKPEIGIRLRSAIHPWMTAWVVVLEHPVFYVTGEDGRFELPDLPPGEYKVAAWHEKLGQTETEVLVKEGDPAEVTFTFTNTGSRSGDQETRTIAEQTTAPM